MPDVKEMASSWGSTPANTRSRKSEPLWVTERTVLKRSYSVAERAAMFQRRASDAEFPFGDEGPGSQQWGAARSGDDHMQKTSTEGVYCRVPGSPSVQELAKAFSKRDRVGKEGESRGRVTLRTSRSSLERLQNGEAGSEQGMTDSSTSEGLSPAKIPHHEQDAVDDGLDDGLDDEREKRVDTTRESLSDHLRLPMKLGRDVGAPCLHLDHQQTLASSSTDGDGETSVDSTPRRTDGETGSRTSSAASPFNSTDGGSTRGGGVDGSGMERPKSTGHCTTSGNDDAMYTLSSRAAVPFGSSALSRNLPGNARGRARGLRPRGSSVITGSASNRIGPSCIPPNGPASLGSSRTPPRFSSINDVSAKDEQTAQAVAEQLAPGVPMAIVVRAAVKIESVMRVLIARGYVRRKLVSEVTAFSLIMERGIEVIKHPFSGKGKPKNVTVNFVSRKGAMQLSWGGKGGVPLETIYGVTKGIKTDALSRFVSPDRAENCFSLLTPERSLDFEVENPWLVLLVVRAMRLFLGAHYDTLPAPTFFSHLCVRPRGSSSTASPKQTLVWTGEDKAPGKELASTPTERTSGDSESDSDEIEGTSNSRARTPWEAIDVVQDSAGPDEVGGGEDDTYCAGKEGVSSICTGEVTPPTPSLPPAAPTPETENSSLPSADRVAPESFNSSNEEGYVEADADADADGEGEGEGHGEANGEVNRAGRLNVDDCSDRELESERSPGGILSLFSTASRLTPEDILRAASSSSSSVAAKGTLSRSRGVSGFRGRARTGAKMGTNAQGDEEERPTASQVLATRGGPTKRLNMAKRMSKPRESGAALKGKRFELMALPAETGRQERRDAGLSADIDPMPQRRQGMSISIGAEYGLPEEDEERPDPESRASQRVGVEDDLNVKLQALRKLCVPHSRMGAFRPSRAPKTMAGKHMPFFQGAGGPTSGAGSGMGSIADMWGDGVRKQYQTDMVRQKNESVEDVRKRDDQRTAMVVTRSGVHRVTRKSIPSDSR